MLILSESLADFLFEHAETTKASTLTNPKIEINLVILDLKFCIKILLVQNKKAFN